MLRLLALAVPLGLDTFAVSAALAASGLTAAERRRVAVVFPVFEMAMPLVGLLGGGLLGRALGGAADWVAALLVVAVGVWMLVGREGSPAGFLDAHGAAVLALGVGISLDELAIGLSLGLLRLPVIAALLLIGLQAALFAQLGLLAGRRVGELEWAERAAGLVLLCLGVVFLAQAAI